MNEQQAAIEDLQEWVDELHDKRAECVNIIEALVLSADIQEIEDAIWRLRAVQS